MYNKTIKTLITAKWKTHNRTESVIKNKKRAQ